MTLDGDSGQQSPADLEKKVRQYFAAGTHTAWVIHVRRRQARIFGPSGAVTEVGKEGFLEAQEILPGIRIALRSIFEPQMD